MILNSPYISGSITVTGNSIVSGSITVLGGLSGSSAQSASYALSASYAISASNALAAQSASYVLNGVSASYAASASNALAAQTASYANALTVAGTLTAQTLVVQTITSSVDYVTGSTRFGSTGSNTHVFTGSMSVTGSIGINVGTPAYSLHVGGNVFVTASDARIYSYSTDNGSFAGLTGQSTSGAGGFHLLSPVTGSTSHVTTVSNYDTYLSTRNANNLIFATNNTERIRISASGNVGIGTVSPAYTLDINGSLRSTSRGLFGNSTFVGEVQGSIALIETSGTYPTLWLRPGGITSPGGLFVSSSGNVGVGTTAPLYKLDVKGGIYSIFDADGDNVINLYNNHAGAYTYGPGGIFIASSNTVSSNTLGSGNGALIVRNGASTYTATIAYNGGAYFASNVGIGATAPGAKLTVVKSSHTSTLGASSVLQICDALSTGEAVGDRAEINFYTNSDSLPGNLQHATIGIIKTSNTGNEIADLYFATSTIGGSPVERIRITSGGNVGIGTTTPGSVKLYVRQDTAQGTTTPALRVSYIGAGDGNPQNVAMFTNDATLATSAYLYIGAYSGPDWYIGKNVAGTSANYNFQLGTGTSTILGTLTTAGVWSTTGGGTSDRRAKKDIADITQEVLPFIKELKPVSFKFKEDAAQKTRRGFIAQDVLETSIPDLVLGDGDQENGIYGLDYDGILALAVKAIQELKAEIDILKNK